MRFYFIGLLLVCACCFTAYGQQDSAVGGVLKPVDPNSVHPFLPDSAVHASRQFKEDSVAMFFIRPDSAVMNSVSSLTDNGFEDSWMQPAQLKNTTDRKIGTVRNSRQPWVLGMATALLLFAAVLNLLMGKDIQVVLQSFLRKPTSSQAERDTGFINSWAVIGLFILFCISSALLLYQAIAFYNFSYLINGFRLFTSITVAIAVLLTLKFLILKFIGFLFEIGPLVSEYLTVLNLTYFNMAFVMLAAAVCFSLIPGRFTTILLVCTAITSGIILIWQFVKNSIGIVSDFRFHKFYLIVYLCALEFCPVLILIKAINR